MIRPIGKFLVACARRSRPLKQVLGIALASVAETLLGALKCSLVQDIREVKRNFQQRMAAETQKKLVDAANAANKATTSDYESAMRKLAIQQKEIENRRREAEVAEVEAKADSAKSEAAIAKAKAFQIAMYTFENAKKKNLSLAEVEFFQALKQYKNEGGRLLVDSSNLTALMNLAISSSDQTMPKQDTKN